VRYTPHSLIKFFNKTDTREKDKIPELGKKLTFSKCITKKRDLKQPKSPMPTNPGPHFRYRLLIVSTSYRVGQTSGYL
jgi:hypothetical protein